MMLSLAYITAEGADPIAAIAAAGAAGFDGVGLRLAGPVGRPHPDSPIGDTARLKAIAGELRARGIALLDVEVLTLAEPFDPAAADMLIAGAAELGARYLQVVCEDPDLDRAADRLARLAEIARGRSLGLALEFMAFRTVDSLATAVQVTARANVPILIDALHLARSGGIAADVAALPPESVAFLQLCDAPAARPADLIHEARFDRLYPGEGALPLLPLIAALPPDRPISIEVPRASMIGRTAREQAREAFAWTQRLLVRRQP